MLDPRGTSIEYSAAVKRDDLVVLLCTTRKRPMRDKKFDQAVYISDLLKAISYKTTYLTDDTVNNLYQRLIEAAEVYDFPVAPVLPTLAVPSTGTTITIVGEQGPRGEDGGATDFSELSVGSDTVVDTFAMTEAYGARWDYLVNGTAQRAGTILATWTEDGLAVDFAETSTPDVNGSTVGITFTVTVVGGNVRLNAIVTSGTWDVVGSRYFIPNSGAGVGAISNQLADGKFYIGDASDVAQPQTLSGDISVTNTGVVSITPNILVNGDISPTAAIAVTKLAALTASRAVVTDGSGVLTVSAVTPTELGYLTGATSNLQTQIDGKIGSVTGAISTVVAVDLTADRAVMSNGAGKVAVSAVTSTELGYVSGVTSAVQTQLNGKVNDTGDVITGTLEIQGGYRTETSGAYLKTKIVTIGDWDMDATSTVGIAHGLGDFKKIRKISVIVRNDADTTYYSLNDTISGGGTVAGSILSIDATNANLNRETGGLFDNTSFDSTSYNRGWITITYEA